MYKKCHHIIALARISSPVLQLHVSPEKLITCLPIIKGNYVRHVASNLIVAALQYRSGQFGLIPELHPQLRKRLFLRRGAQKHQRRLPPRCDRLPPGSE